MLAHIDISQVVTEPTGMIDIDIPLWIIAASSVAVGGGFMIAITALLGRKVLREHTAQEEKKYGPWCRLFRQLQATKNKDLRLALLKKSLKNIAVITTNQINPESAARILQLFESDFGDHDTKALEIIDRFIDIYPLRPVVRQNYGTPGEDEEADNEARHIKSDEHGHKWKGRGECIAPYSCIRCGVLSGSDAAVKKCKSDGEEALKVGEAGAAMRSARGQMAEDLTTARQPYHYERPNM